MMKFENEFGEPVRFKWSLKKRVFMNPDIIIEIDYASNHYKDLFTIKEVKKLRQTIGKYLKTFPGSTRARQSRFINELQVPVEIKIKKRHLAEDNPFKQTKLIPGVSIQMFRPYSATQKLMTMKAVKRFYRLLGQILKSL